MCQAQDPHEVRVAISPEGRKRQQQLLQWIDQDIEAKDFTFTASLSRWRDDVVTRIAAHRPQMICIPHSFVSALRLPGQRVVILEQNEIRLCAFQFGSKSKEATERVIVPPRGE